MSRYDAVVDDTIQRAWDALVRDHPWAASSRSSFTDFVIGYVIDYVHALEDEEVLSRRECASCGEHVDEDGYCTEYGCSYCGKVGATPADV